METQPVGGGALGAGGPGSWCCFPSRCVIGLKPTEAGKEPLTFNSVIQTIHYQDNFSGDCCDREPCWILAGYYPVEARTVPLLSSLQLSADN